MSEGKKRCSQFDFWVHNDSVISNLYFLYSLVLSVFCKGLKILSRISNQIFLFFTVLFSCPATSSSSVAFQNPLRPTYWLRAPPPPPRTPLPRKEQGGERMQPECGVGDEGWRGSGHLQLQQASRSPTLWQLTARRSLLVENSPVTSPDHIMASSSEISGVERKKMNMWRLFILISLQWFGHKRGIWKSGI